MPENEIIPLTDEELATVTAEDIPKLTSEERRRLSRVRPQAKSKMDELRIAGDNAMAIERDNKRQTAGYAPAVAGAAGGLMGGPLGAAAGGVVGDAVRQAGLRELGGNVPEGVVDQAKSMATEGVTQGLMEGTGRIAGGVAKKSARFLMNRAANVSDRLAREFPELSQTLIDNAITMSNGGYDKARGLLKTAKGKATEALRTADVAGKRVPVQLTPEIAESLKTATIEAAMKAGTARATAGQPLTVATARLDARTQHFLNTIDQALQSNSPLALSPFEADMLKTQLQRESKNMYAAVRGPNGTPAIAQDAAVRAEFATRLNEMIDGVAPGYREANATAQEFIGATRAVQQAVRPGKNLYMAMVRPTTGAVLGSIAGNQQDQPGIGAAAGAIAATPLGMSSMAISLANPVVQQLLRQMPRALAEQVAGYLNAPPTEEAPEGP